MFANQFANRPPVRAVIWDLDGMVLQIETCDGEMSLMDLETLLEFILALGQEYRSAVLSRQRIALAARCDSFERLVLPLDRGRSDGYHQASRRLEVQPSQSVVIGIDPKRLVAANRMGFQTIAFHNLRQMASELLPLLAEPLAA